MNQILQNIRKLRISKEISQEAIANSLKMTQSAYAKLERGQTKLSLERYLLISVYFDVDKSVLLQDDIQI
ncbi:MAG: helix-turn-helix transcriptional regulator [Cytophagales bacterium]|nr:helix-turn-helix transcriptional regulator [Cytophagales bacterium]